MSSACVLADDREALAAALRVRRGGGPVALVPTMGALHDGHASLMDAARQAAGAGGSVVTSVFVNPLQFGAGEDLDRYPRTLGDDLRLCGDHGVDVVFAPSVEEVYPEGEPLVTVEPGPQAADLEGASRPGHFRGVLTVVAKLLGLVRPDIAVFGEKDYQQLVLVRRMAADLCLGVDVLGVPTVREPDGLALSSRNRYLTPEQRRAATVLSRALRAARALGSYGAPVVRAAALHELGSEPGVALDYLVLRDPDLGDLPTDYPAAPVEARMLVAARVGSTRLLDNAALQVGPLHAADHTVER